MARIRLNILDWEAQTVEDGQGVAITLTFLRLTALLYVGTRPYFQDGLIDTGAPLSLFPEKHWKLCEADIEWLTFPRGAQPNPWWTTASGLMGGSCPCRLGRVSVIAADPQRNRLPAVNVIAKFAEDGGTLSRILLGLEAGILTGRRVIADPDLREAWLEER